MKGQKVLLSSNSDEWETPEHIISWLAERFNFDLDPCASKENAKCYDFFTKEDNGLFLNWHGRGFRCAFVNPPYSDIAKWIEKCYLESEKGMTVVLLIPARVDTRYWHDFIFNKAKEIIFIKGRLKFNNHKNPATFPSAIIVFKKRLFCMKPKVKTLEQENTR